MGCKSSSRFVVDEFKLGCDQPSNTLMESLFLTRNDLDILMTAFSDIDADGSHTIRFDEFMTYFRIDRTKFNEAVFSLLDNNVNGEGFLTFLDFVVVMWNFLTITNDKLAQFAFLLFDKDDTGSLDTEEVIRLVYTIHNIKKQTRVKTINHVVDKLRETKDIFSVAKFEGWLRTHMSLMEPVQILQRNLRLNIIGEKFWSNLADIRAQHEEFRDIRYILKMKQRAIDIREHQIRSIYLRFLQQSKNAEAQIDIAGARRLRGKRTTSMLKFFHLVQPDGSIVRLHKSDDKKPVAVVKGAKDKRKVGPVGIGFDCVSRLADEEDKNEAEGKELSAPPVSVLFPKVETVNTETDTTKAARIKDVVQLPDKPRRRRSSLFGRPNLRRKENGNGKEPVGVRAIRKRRRLRQHQRAGGRGRGRGEGLGAAYQVDVEEDVSEEESDDGEGVV